MYRDLRFYILNLDNSIAVILVAVHISVPFQWLGKMKQSAE